jgi:CubicO group peptidase (beta-lactamase class C family)
MAGLLVEKISGTDYETYMLANVLKPLGITTAHPVAPSPEMVELMALPYMPGGANGPPRPVAQVHFDVFPAGDIYLTAEEMARFLGAHLNGGTFQGGRILTAESVKKAHEPRFGGTYGFGWAVRKDATGHTIISHTGGIPGQSSNMVGDVDAKVGVYYMSNSGAPAEIADAAIALLRGEDYTPLADRKRVAVDQKVLDTYVGVYDVTPEIALTITRDGENLFMQPGPQPRAQLLAVSSVKFMGEGITLTFARNAAGTVQTVLVEPGGGPTLTGTRRK